MPFEFVLFALTLAGVALLHGHSLRIALVGMASIVAWKLAFTGFEGVAGWTGLVLHLGHEWVVLTNLFALLVGFALLARHFEASGVPGLLPAILPDDWTGGLALLAMVFVLSSFLDNIAAAIIGATTAASVFRHRLHVGYLAAIVAASNAGGAGSVIGDTTTTMMWIQGVAPRGILHAYVGSLVAFLVFAIPAAHQQQRHSPIRKDPSPALALDWPRAIVVGCVLAAAVVANVAVNLLAPAAAGRFPVIGASIWASLIAAMPWRRPDWAVVPSAARGSLFLLALVTSASLMPVERLPPASAAVSFGLGWTSAVFDNIPLTKLALEQGGYDWGALAYSVGFGGSMVWFGSSAGVAVASLFPMARSARSWLRHGWHVLLAYPLGFLALMWTMGWHPAGR
jgi:Na+/H+ antiporter NhaD/arsenite permease-like protein